MSYFYDVSTAGFFLEGLHKDIPHTAIKLTDIQYKALIDGQTQGKQIIADKTGNLVLIDPQPSAAHVLNLDTLTWDISAEKQSALFAQQKEGLLNKLADKADHNTPTPMLSQIARVRGVPLEVLIEKVIEKSAQFAVAIGIIIGQRQAFEDRLLALKTPEELTSLEQEIEQWQFQAN